MQNATAAQATPKAPQQAARRDVTEYGFRRVVIIVGVMAAALMQTLDTTITNVALPTIQGNLGATAEEATWVVTAYTIAAIIVIPITPWLQDRFGRKNYFAASIIGFTIASVACGISDNLTLLVTSRVVQGAFGGGLLATAQAILRDTFPPRQLGASQAIFALGAIMGPALGPPIGGWLVDNFTWNWVFFINVLPGTAATTILLIYLRDPTSPRKAAVDFVGLVLLFIALSSMQYALTMGERDYWLQDLSIVVMTVLCITGFAAFVWWELRMTRMPIVDLAIFKNPSVASGSILALALGAVVFGSTYVLPQLTQGPLGFTPTLSGELFILRAIPIAVCTPFTARFAGRMDTRWLLAAGFLLMALGSWMQAQVTTYISVFWSFAAPLAIVGVAAALLFVPISIAVLRNTTPSEGPKAAAMVNLAVQLGGSISVALMDVVVDRRMTYHSELIDTRETLASNATHQFLAHHGTLLQLFEIVRGQASVLAFADATYVMAFLALACSPLVLIMRRPRPEQAGNMAA
jgi:MFS transporter, DHA2 family, multidrug resistance protein